MTGCQSLIFSKIKISARNSPRQSGKTMRSENCVELHPQSIWWTALNVLSKIDASYVGKSHGGPNRRLRVYLDEVLVTISDTNTQREGTVQLQKIVEPPQEQDGDCYYDIVVRTSRGRVRKFVFPVNCARMPAGR